MQTHPPDHPESPAPAWTDNIIGQSIKETFLNERRRKPADFPDSTSGIGLGGIAYYAIQVQITAPFRQQIESDIRFDEQIHHLAAILAFGFRHQIQNRVVPFCI